MYLETARSARTRRYNSTLCVCRRFLHTACTLDGLPRAPPLSHLVVQPEADSRILCQALTKTSPTVHADCQKVAADVDAGNDDDAGSSQAGHHGVEHATDDDIGFDLPDAFGYLSYHAAAAAADRAFGAAAADGDTDSETAARAEGAAAFALDADAIGALDAQPEAVQALYKSTDNGADDDTDSGADADMDAHGAAEAVAEDAVEDADTCGERCANC